MNIAILFLVAATGMRSDGMLTPGARDVSMRVPRVVSGAVTPAPTITMDALAYDETTVCNSTDNPLVITGTATDVTGVAWATSETLAGGACTGTTTWSCTISGVAPADAAEAIENVVVTATGAGGTDDASVEVGTYYQGAGSTGPHSCWHSQSVDGSYNSTLANNDAVAAWVNLGGSALDVTQGTGTAQPTFKTAIVNGNPVVRCDGGDFVAATTASDWKFLSDGSVDTTVGVVVKPVSGTTVATFLGTKSAFSVANIGLVMHQTVSNDRLNVLVSDGTTNVVSMSSSDNAVPDTAYSSAVSVIDVGVGSEQYANGVLAGTSTASGFSASNPSAPLQLCAGNSQRNMDGDLTRVTIYAEAIDSTARAINKAVDEWMLGGTLPVTP